jgi:outer membrane receptor for ferrienterochelin and colicin
LKGLGLGFIGLYSNDNYGQGWYTTSDQGNNHTWSSFIPYVRFDRSVAENMNVMAYVQYNASREKGAQTNQAGWWSPAGTNGIFQYDVLTKNIQAYGKYSWDIIKPISVIAGVNFDARWQDTSSYTQASNDHANVVRLFNKVAYTYSAFLQARMEAPLLNGLIFTGGLRSDNGNLNAEVYNQISPRAAAVLKVLDNLSVKAMYSTALKPPGPDNISHNAEKLADSTVQDSMAKYGYALNALRSEVIQSFEGNITFAQGNLLYLSGTGFYNIIGNALQRTQMWKQVNTDFWQNSDINTYAAGCELEAQIAPIEPLRFWLNGSFTRTWKKDTTATGEDTLIYDIVTDIPFAKSNIGVNYAAPFGLNVYLIVKGIWALVRPDVTEAFWTDFDPGYWLVDVNFRQAIGKSFNVELGISNLLNKEYSYLRGTIPGDNRTISLGISSSF